MNTTEKYIAFLRGINVGGNNKLKMAELKSSLMTLGLQNIVTYIQSGNLVFESALSSKQLQSTIKEKIAEDFGMQVPVVIRTVKEIRQVCQENPFMNDVTDENKSFHVSFLSEIPSQKEIDSLQAFEPPKDKFKLIGREVYLYCPEGYGRTKLTNTFFEKKLQVTVTTRNWKTICHMVELASSVN